MSRGTAVAELAVCLPAIVALVFGAVECCSMIFVKQSLHVASYEAIRAAVKHDATNVEVLDRCNQVLAERNVNGATIELNPTDVAAVSRGTDIEVKVSAPCEANSIARLNIFSGTLEAETIMIKE
jgi:Flp pilus assembly protein TadG